MPCVNEIIFKQIRNIRLVSSYEITICTEVFFFFLSLCSLLFKPLRQFNDLIWIYKQLQLRKIFLRGKFYSQKYLFGSSQVAYGTV